MPGLPATYDELYAYYDSITNVTIFNRQIAYVLGYSARRFDSRYYPQPLQFPEFDSDARVLIVDLMAKLGVIDAELISNRADSMALDVGGVKVDFARNISITKQEGSRLLRELSIMTDIPVAHDRYLGRSPTDSSITPLSVKNYA